MKDEHFNQAEDESCKGYSIVGSAPDAPASLDHKLLAASGRRCRASRSMIVHSKGLPELSLLSRIGEDDETMPDVQRGVCR